MKKASVLKTTGLISAYLACHFMAMQFYMMIPIFWIGVQETFRAIEQDATAPDVQRILVLFEEALPLHLPLSVFFAAGISILVYRWIAKQRSMQFKKMCQWSLVPWIEWILPVALGMSLFLLNAYLMGLVDQSGILTEAVSELEALSHVLMRTPFWLGFLSIAVVTALIEEIIFRGLILYELQRHMKAAPAILIQAVLFALYHINPAQMIYTLLLGLVMGVMTVWARSIIPAVMLHFALNGMSFLLARFYTGDLLERYPIAWITISVIVTMGCMFMLWQRRRSYEHADL